MARIDFDAHATSSPRPPPSPLPFGWVEATDAASGKPYYHHLASDRIAYSRPARTLPSEPFEVVTPSSSGATYAGSPPVVPQNNDDSEFVLPASPQASTSTTAQGSVRRRFSLLRGRGGGRSSVGAGDAMPGISLTLATPPITTSSSLPPSRRRTPGSDSGSSISSSVTEMLLQQSPPPPYSSPPPSAHQPGVPSPSLNSPPGRPPYPPELLRNREAGSRSPPAPSFSPRSAGPASPPARIASPVPTTASQSITPPVRSQIARRPSRRGVQAGSSRSASFDDAGSRRDDTPQSAPPPQRSHSEPVTLRDSDGSRHRSRPAMSATVTTTPTSAIQPALAAIREDAMLRSSPPHDGRVSSRASTFSSRRSSLNLQAMQPTVEDDATGQIYMSPRSASHPLYDEPSDGVIRRDYAMPQRTSSVFSENTGLMRSEREPTSQSPRSNSRPANSDGLEMRPRSPSVHPTSVSSPSAASVASGSTYYGDSRRPYSFSSSDGSMPRRRESTSSSASQAHPSGAPSSSSGYPQMRMPMSLSDLPPVFDEDESPLMSPRSPDLNAPSSSRFPPSPSHAAAAAYASNAGATPRLRPHNSGDSVSDLGESLGCANVGHDPGHRHSSSGQQVDASDVIRASLRQERSRDAAYHARAQIYADDLSSSLTSSSLRSERLLNEISRIKLRKANAKIADSQDRLAQLGRRDAALERQLQKERDELREWETAKLDKGIMHDLGKLSEEEFRRLKRELDREMTIDTLRERLHAYEADYDSDPFAYEYEELPGDARYMPIPDDLDARPLRREDYASRSDFVGAALQRGFLPSKAVSLSERLYSDDSRSRAHKARRYSDYLPKRPGRLYQNLNGRSHQNGLDPFDTISNSRYDPFDFDDEPVAGRSIPRGDPYAYGFDGNAGYLSDPEDDKMFSTPRMDRLLIPSVLKKSTSSMGISSLHRPLIDPFSGGLAARAHFQVPGRTSRGRRVSFADEMGRVGPEDSMFVTAPGFI